MMSCSGCGAKFESPADGTCPSCGARFENLPSPAQGKPAAQETPPKNAAELPAGQDKAREARAGFWIRLAAVIIDFILLSFAKGFLTGVGLRGTEGLLAIPILNMLYFIGLTANGGQTLGKKLLGIKVVRMDGSEVGLGRSALRWACYFISAIPLYMGYIWVGATTAKRGWHDLICGTKVVYTDPATAAAGRVFTPEEEKAGKKALFICLGIFLLLLSLLAAVAIPKFSVLLRHSNEGASKGNLGAIRSALSIYYGDMEGVYPSDLEALTVGAKYMVSLPQAKIPNFHKDSNQVHHFPSRSQASSSDSGGWGYVNNPSDTDFGTVWVNCSHTDIRGMAWTAY